MTSSGSYERKEFEARVGCWQLTWEGSSIMSFRAPYRLAMTIETVVSNGSRNKVQPMHLLTLFT